MVWSNSSLESRHSRNSPPPSDATDKQRINSSALPPLTISYTSVAEFALLGLDPWLQQMVEHACLTTRATAAALALRFGDEIVCRAANGPNAPDIGVRIDAGSGLSGACIRTREIQFCEDTESDPRVDAAACRQLQVRSVLIVPLLGNDELFGVFEIFSTSPYAFDGQDLQDLQALSHAIVEQIIDSSRPSSAPEAAASDPNPPDLPMDEGSGSETGGFDPMPVESGIFDSTPIEPGIFDPGPLDLGAFEADAVSADAVAEETLEDGPVEQAAAAQFPSGRTSRHQVAGWPEINTAGPDQIFEAGPALDRQGDDPVFGEQDSAEIVAAKDAELFSSLPTASAREWTTSLLTITIIVVALVLGWMLGRSEWRRVASPKRQPIAADAEQPQPSEEADFAVSFPGTGDRVVPAKPKHLSSSSSTPLSQKSENTSHPETSDGLVVYEGGKVIFRQKSREWGAKGLNASGGRPETIAVSLSAPMANARIIHRVEPVYPERARQLFIQGEVILEALVGTDGSVQQLKLISGDSDLAVAAGDAVRQWRFQPYQTGGKAADFTTRLSVDFRLK
jgi:TonB family protein